jgi:hypothetical protein
MHMEKPHHYGLTPFDGEATVGGIPNSQVIIASQRVCGTTILVASWAMPAALQV